MKYYKIGIPDDKALDRMQKLGEIDKVILSPLKRLDNLLGILKEHNPGSIPQYVGNLERKLLGLVRTNYVEKRNIDLKQRLSELKHMGEYSVLAERALNYLLGELKLPEDGDWSDDMQVVQRDYLQAFLSSRYHNVDVLTESIAREQAIEIYKQHFEKIVKERVANAEVEEESLEKFSEDSRNEDPENPGWLRVVSEPEDGKVLVRKDTCLWADAMKEYPDSELKFLVCCYGDYFSIKLRNSNFELTMENSIAGGHPYCDCVIHDTSINERLDHPSDEFFASLKPST